MNQVLKSDPNPKQPSKGRWFFMLVSFWVFLVSVDAYGGGYFDRKVKFKDKDGWWSNFSVDGWGAGGDLGTYDPNTEEFDLELGNARVTVWDTNQDAIRGANTYTGGTTITSGTLVYNGTNTAMTVTNASGATLKGSGSIGHYIGPGTISPGQSPGTLSVTNLTLSGGGEYHWEITNANSTAGIGWDLISVDNPGTGDGTVQIDATVGNTYTVRVDSTGLSDADFDNTRDYTWTIIDAGTLNGGFATNKFTLNTNSFTNAVGSGVFYLAELNSNVVLRFSSTRQAIPTRTGCRTHLRIATGSIWRIRRMRIWTATWMG